MGVSEIQCIMTLQEEKKGTMKQKTKQSQAQRDKKTRKNTLMTYGQDQMI